MSAPLVQINDDTIVNLFQTTRIQRHAADKQVTISLVGGGQETLSGDAAENFWTYAKDVADQVPTPTAPEPPGTSSRDFGAILGDDDVGTSHPASDTPPNGETPASAAT